MLYLLACVATRSILSSQIVPRMFEYDTVLHLFCGCLFSCVIMTRWLRPCWFIVGSLFHLLYLFLLLMSCGAICYVVHHVWGNWFWLSGSMQPGFWNFQKSWFLNKKILSHILRAGPTPWQKCSGLGPISNKRSRRIIGPSTSVEEKVEPT